MLAMARIERMCFAVRPSRQPVPSMFGMGGVPVMVQSPGHLNRQDSQPISLRMVSALVRIPYIHPGGRR